MNGMFDPSAPLLSPLMAPIDFPFTEPAISPDGQGVVSDKDLPRDDHHNQPEAKLEKGTEKEKDKEKYSKDHKAPQNGSIKSQAAQERERGGSVQPSTTTQRSDNKPQQRGAFYFLLSSVLFFFL